MPKTPNLFAKRSIFRLEQLFLYECENSISPDRSGTFLVSRLVMCFSSTHIIIFGSLIIIVRSSGVATVRHLSILMLVSIVWPEQRARKTAEKHLRWHCKYCEYEHSTAKDNILVSSPLDNNNNKYVTTTAVAAATTHKVKKNYARTNTPRARHMFNV